MDALAKKRNAQLTLMMLVGIILALVFFLLYLLATSLATSITLPFDRNAIQEYVNNCFKQTAEESAILLGKQGGRTRLQPAYIAAKGFGISYALKQDAPRVPSIREMEDDLSWHIDVRINDCLKNLKDFKSQGWKVEAGTFSSVASINRNDVDFRATFPFTVTAKEGSLTFRDFTIMLPVRLEYLHTAMGDVTQFSLEQGKRVDLTYLNGQDFNTTIFPYQNALVYRFIDEASAMRSQPYEFMFAIG